MNHSFDNLILTGRAGAGKSEFIDFLKKIPETERLEKYHIGAFEEVDDFPWLYAMLKDEDLWEQLGRSRKLARRVGNVYITLDYDVYKFLTLKFNQVLKKRISDNPNLYDSKTLFLEFARGEEDGFKTAFKLFDKEILSKSVIFFMDNTFEESMRRNTVRSNDNDPNQTILNHKIPVEVMERYYKIHDWHELTGKKPHGYLEVQGLKIPFVTVWNIPESHDFKTLEERYSPPLKKLWELYTFIHGEPVEP